MSYIRKFLHLLWRIITFPVWCPWLLVTKFGHQMWRGVQALWSAGRWLATKLWRLNVWFFTTFYWTPFKFIIKTVPLWLYRTILTPIGRMIKSLNTLTAHGIYHVLNRWMAAQHGEAAPPEELSPPAPQLKTQIVAHCLICSGDTLQARERISESTVDTLDTCTRCGSRQAGTWDDTPALLEAMA